MSALNETIPWASSPLIINAPMADNAGGALASAVTLAGGFGMIGTKFKVEKARSELEIARKIFASHAPLSTANTLPVGIGFLPIINKLEDAIPVIAEFRPAVVWLFGAPKLAHYATWTEAVRTASPDSKVWIQLGSVAAAVQVGKQAKPDALCLQGADAGGHGFVKGASIVSLVPEATDVLEREGMGDIPLLASGGIVDGRGVAAALALGAQGVVMGTRFLAAEEVLLHPAYQAAILEAQDGGQVTRRSKLFDQLYGPNIWPEEYDGRSLVTRSYRDFLDGVSLEEIQKLHSEAIQDEDEGFATGLEGRAAIWAGTGVGLVSKKECAANIVKSVREEAINTMERLAKRQGTGRG
jgi:nitronate monooxygenase